MTAAFVVRVAELPDLAAVSSLLEVSYPALLARGYEPQVLAKALPLMTRANPQLLASGTFYVAHSRGQHLVGCGGWTKEQPGSAGVVEGEGHIRHFATHPEWIRRGVASALLRRCLSDAEAAGITRLECYSSLVAVAFYRALGFVPVRSLELALTADVSLPGLLMRLELA